MKGRLEGVSATEAFDRLADFGSYAALAPSIRSIDVERVDDNTVRTKWNVSFRGGTMKWTEEDRLDRAAGKITYDLVEGSLKEFKGAWELKDVDGGSEVRFTCEFGLGMPAMSSFIDPLAERAIRDNVKEILQGLFGEAYTPTS
jgi:ribosome-associated toxin RatA of RatAB toxin-antitoxin module